MVARIDPGRVTFYPGEPTAWVVNPGHPPIRELDLRATRVQAGARIRVRVRTGLLLSTIRKQPGFRKSFIFVDVVAGRRDMDYAWIEEAGSIPHVIRARRRKVLRFVAHGKVVFRTAVRHPGTKGSHYLSASLPLAGG